MRRFFKQPVVRFVLVVMLIVAYSLAAKVSLEESFSTLFDTGVDTGEIVSSPSPTPQDQGFDTDIKSSSESALVSEVIDGDTIRLSTGKVVRYIGIDTPETVHPIIDTECFGSEANTANELLVLGKQVRLEKDVRDTDRYGRLLRYVWLDGVMVNEKLIRDGYAIARVYPPDTKYQAIFEIAESEARESDRGLWASCSSK